MTKKSTFVPAKDLSKLWRAIIEFDMLQPGDRILVGLSGGKDSMLLTAMLAEIKKYSPIPFDLACYTVNGMFAPNFPKAELEAFCAQFGLTHYSDDVDVMAAHEKRVAAPALPVPISAVQPPTAAHRSLASTRWPWHTTMTMQWKPSL